MSSQPKSNVGLLLLDRHRLGQVPRLVHAGRPYPLVRCGWRSRIEFDSRYGAPVLTSVQLEQLIPAGMLRVERIPTLPDAANVSVSVTVTAGSVIGWDCDHKDVTVDPDTSQPFHVAATGVANVKFIVRVPAL